MRIIKPSTLGVMHSTLPASTDAATGLVVTGLVGFRLDAPAELLDDQQIWSLVRTYSRTGVAVDHWMPKPQGEFILWGSAFSDVPVKKMDVRVRCGSLEKRLLVHGDRYWEPGPLGWRPSEATFFTQMPLAQSRGPADFLEKMACFGTLTGREPLLTPLEAQLPNFEAPDNPCLHPDDVVPLAGFGPDGQLSLEGNKGRLYTNKWLAHEHPAFPAGLDFRVFNISPVDQRISGFWRGGEPIEIDGMHPERAQLRCSLPNIVMRCFPKRVDQDSVRIENTLRIDTVLFFPNQLAAVMVYRCIVENAGVDGGAIDELALVMELPDVSRVPESDGKSVEKSVITRFSATRENQGDLSVLKRKQMVNSVPGIAISLNEGKQAVAFEATHETAAFVRAAIVTKSTNEPGHPHAERVRNDLQSLDASNDEAREVWPERPSDAGRISATMINSQLEPKYESLYKQGIADNSETPFDNLREIDIEGELRRIAQALTRSDEGISSQLKRTLGEWGLKLDGKNLLPISAGTPETPYARATLADALIKSADTAKTFSLNEQITTQSEKAFDQLPVSLRRLIGEGESLDQGQLESLVNMLALAQPGELIDLSARLAGDSVERENVALLHTMAPASEIESMQIGSQTVAANAAAMGIDPIAAAEPKAALDLVIQLAVGGASSKSILESVQRATGDAQRKHGISPLSVFDAYAGVEGIRLPLGEETERASDLGHFSENPTIQEALEGLRGHALDIDDLSHLLGLHGNPATLESATGTPASPYSLSDHRRNKGIETSNVQSPAEQGELDHEHSSLQGLGAQSTSEIAGLSGAAAFGARRAPSVARADVWSDARRRARGVALPNVAVHSTTALGAKLLELCGQSKTVHGMDFAGVNLRGADLRGADLRGAFLEKADLRNADLSGARLDDAVLTLTNVENATFVGASAVNANLSGIFGAGSIWIDADLSEVSLVKADMTLADFTRARLHGIDATRANFTRAELIETVSDRGTWRHCNLTSARMDKVSWNKADLSACKISGLTAVKAKLLNSMFSGVIGHGVDLSEARMDGCNFIDAQLTRLTARALRAKQSSWYAAQLAEAIFDDAFLTETQFGSANLLGASMQRSNLSESILSDARLEGALFVEAQLYSAALRNADMRNADLRGATLRGADLQGALLEHCDVSNADVDGTLLAKPTYA